jgi:hypothetical protein
LKLSQKAGIRQQEKMSSRAALNLAQPILKALGKQSFRLLGEEPVAVSGR